MINVYVSKLTQTFTFLRGGFCVVDNALDYNTGHEQANKKERERKKNCEERSAPSYNNLKVVVVVVLLFYVRGKHLRSCRDDQLT